MAPWAVEWQTEYHADKRATEVLVEAMARFVQELKKQGKSPRSLSGIYSDLSALGMLNFSYNSPKGEKVLDELYDWQYEFDRKFAFSKNESRRYAGAYEQFCNFLGRWES